MAFHSFVRFGALGIASFFFLVACSGSDSNGGSSGTTSGSSSGGSSSGSTSSSSSSSSSSGSGGAGCSGEITTCQVGTLSTKQLDDMCSLLLASIDDPPGTKLECTSGDKKGLFITVNSKEQCVSQPPPASCKVTVGQLIDCYKAAKKDACGAFADTGACGKLFSPESGCSG